MRFDSLPLHERLGHKKATNSLGQIKTILCECVISLPALIATFKARTHPQYVLMYLPIMALLEFIEYPLAISALSVFGQASFYICLFPITQVE